jgi:hypothetical protein
MAVTITLYDQSAKRFANSEVDLTKLYFMLLDDDATFDATDTDLSGLAAEEVSGFGWTAGGENLENAAVTVITTNDAKLDADDITVTATGGAIGPAYKGVLYDLDDTVSPNLMTPIAFVDFDGVREAGETTDFVVRWHTNGIVTWTYT